MSKLIKEFTLTAVSERDRGIDFISINSTPSDFKSVIDTK